MNEVTQILGAMRRGDRRAANDLLPLVYQELRRLAAFKMANESPGHTLQPTALVHEAWLRLVDKAGQAQLQTRPPFCGAAAKAMPPTLINTPRRKRAQKHGGGQQR